MFDYLTGLLASVDVGNKLESVRWEDRGWMCRVRFGYDGEGVRLWKREYLPRPLGVVVRLTLYAGYGYEESYVEEVQPHEAGAGEPPSEVCGKVEGVTDLGFTGQRQEIGFGLYDYKARYFSPALGRFISPDSIVPDFSNPQALNRYAYVYGNPLKYTDPSGHCGIVGGGSGNPAVMSHSCLEALGGAAVAYAVVAAANQFDLAVDLDLNPHRPSSSPPVQDTSVLIFVPGDPTDAEEFRTVTLDTPEIPLILPFPSGPPDILEEEVDTSPVTSELRQPYFTISKQQQKSIRSFNRRIAEHKAKLEAYKQNPDIFDNQGRLKNAPSSEIRQKMIEGRIAKLEREIQKFEQEIQKILEENKQ